jgi:copper chaperone NosL
MTFPRRPSSAFAPRSDAARTHSRRDFFSLSAVLMVSALAACKKDPAPGSAAPTVAGRCSHCGMKLVSDSPWFSEIVTEDGQKLGYDTPRCALTASLSGKKGKVRVQDFYDRKWHDAGEVRFVIGSDVLGPMGPDLVPVDTGRAGKFQKDHQGEKTLSLVEITKSVLDDLK